MLRDQARIVDRNNRRVTTDNEKRDCLPHPPEVLISDLEKRDIRLGETRFIADIPGAHANAVHKLA